MSSLAHRAADARGEFMMYCYMNAPPALTGVKPSGGPNGDGENAALASERADCTSGDHATVPTGVGRKRGNARGASRRPQRALPVRTSLTIETAHLKQTALVGRIYSKEFQFHDARQGDGSL
jgi:hypothetical protein